MSDSTFLHIENAAHGGAFGNNTIPEPTEAQCIAGNYKVGRANLYGLPLAIEQPRGSYRTGIDAKTGKRWASRMAAHYGYISGTKGADDDAVDCFIGFYPQSETAYVINQNVGGRFDEHKVMLAFPDEDTARRAYLDSYERGWNGLASLVPASISQLKWWLKNGDLRRPLRADNLPHEGLETMTRKVQWNSDALPYDNTLDHVLYEIRCADAGEGLLMDAVKAQEITEDADGLLAFDALVSPYAKLERKMELLRGVMERTGDKVKPVAMQITEPFKQRGVANVAAIFELSDGQTVSIFFHNPDVTPGKMAPTDEVISWKWLLNKKDITIVVAPERGADLNVREVARRIMRLAEKNSPAFQRLNAKRAERMGAIQSLKDEITGLEAELSAAQHELEVAKVDAEDAQNKKNRAYADAVQQVSILQDAYLRATENGGTDPKTGQTKEALAAQIDRQSAEAQRLRDIANGVTPAEPPEPPHYSAQTLKTLVDSYGWEDTGHDSVVKAFPGVGPLGGQMVPDGTRKIYAGYRFDERKRYIAAIFGDDQLFDIDGRDREPADVARELNERVEAWVAERQAANGYANPAPAAAPAAVAPDLSYRRSADGLFTTFLPNTPEGEKAWRTMNATQGSEGGKILAAHTDAVIQQIRDAGYTVAEDTSGPTTAEEADALAAALEAPPQPDEQALIDAYFKSWGEEAAQINAAVAAINWEGITDTASAAAEMQKLRDAANSDRPIEKARDALEAIGIKSWDDRLASVTDSPGFKAQGDAMDAYRAATDKIQAVAKEKLIEAGKAELAALPEGAPLADVARAVFRKNGIDIGQRGEGWVARVVQQIEAKDADGLREILAGVGSDSNKASMEIFERATGVKLAKTQRERGRQIDEWAGITPEKRAELEAAKDAAWLARERERKVKESWDALKAMNVRNNGTGVVSDGQQYLLGQVAGGYDTVGSFKRGAATVYGLEKGTDLVFVNNRTFTNFLKSAIAFGGLRQALELVGAVEPKAAEAQGGAEQIAAVDAAYKFESATDSFKLWLHESLNKADYSPFVTAKAMDEAAKRHGATVEWDKALAALDDVGHAVASLEASLAVVENNAPINQAEGDILQAGLETETAKSIREAIATLTEADYAPSEEDIGGMFEAEAVTLDSSNEPPVKALLASLRSFLGQQQALDAVPALDGTEHVGTIKMAGEVIGRIDIADDGKAMVYVGAAGDERVVFPSGARAMYSDDDAVLMVDALFSMREAAAPAPAVSYADNDPDAPGIYKRDAGYLAVKQAASLLGVAVQDAEVDANLVINASIAYGGKSLKVEISPHGWVNVGSEQIMINPNVSTATTAADGQAIADAVKAQAEAAAAEGGPAGGQPEPGVDEVDYSRMFDPSVITEMNVLKHLHDSVLAAKHEGNAETAIESDRILSLFVDTLTPQQFKSYDHDKAEGVLRSKLREVEQELGLGAPPDTTPDVPELIAAGFRRVLNNDYVRAVQADDKKLQFNVRVTEDGFIVRLTVGFSGGITGAATEIGRTTDVGAAIALADAEAAKRGAGDGQADPQKAADRALFQSVIDGTVADILAPELADDLEAAYTRNQSDAELAALFEQAVAAYQAAMMAATSSLA
ncbi:hypothetical protein F7Q92_15210 [Ideonella dechloratans]|uniref:Uncharacterized protein n=1 Tax=Ideonella dechloratans TaxID=36863 RepID=A0A643FCY0_IDEDE|nr:hypothetical protein [Ideonella dechloratans]KAB0579194.1 hypothetical protein F7Q92_15210 [Ideonella dechloratans]UFU12147.1 hypothetical protein LRM40_20695 [Ideonella dechloratans]